MGREGGDWPASPSAGAYRCSAIAAIFWGQHHPTRKGIKIAFWPAVVCTRNDFDQFFSRQFLPSLCRIKMTPVFMQLVAPMLGREQSTVTIDRKANCVADTRCEARGWTKVLRRTSRVEAPDACAKRFFRAGHLARRPALSIADLTSVGGAAAVHEQAAIRAQSDAVAVMIAMGGQSGHHLIGRTPWLVGGIIQSVAQDIVAILQEQSVAIDGDACAPGLVGERTLDLVGASIAIPVPQQDQAGCYLAIFPIGRTIRVNRAVHSHRQMAHMPQFVSEDFGTEVGRQCQAAR